MTVHRFLDTTTLQSTGVVAHGSYLSLNLVFRTVSRNTKHVRKVRCRLLVFKRPQQHRLMIVSESTKAIVSICESVNADVNVKSLSLPSVALNSRCDSIIAYRTNVRDEPEPSIRTDGTGSTSGLKRTNGPTR